jgi:hypothetical protein
MDCDYFEPETPPSCAMTCVVMIIAAVAVSPTLFIPLFWEDESTYFLSILIVTAIFSIVMFPVSWWAAKRVKKWARISVEGKKQEEQYT